MLRVVVSRLAWSIALLWAVSVLIFVGTGMISGDAATAILGQHAADPIAVQTVRKNLGLDKPPLERYLRWLSDVLHGDLGRSLTVGATAVGVSMAGDAASGGVAEQGVPVTDLIRHRVVNSAVLAGIAALLTVPFALLLGVICALRPGGMVDSTVSTVTLGLIALPEFVTGTAFVLLFAITWHWFPAVSLVSSGEGVGDRIRELALPVLTLAAASVAQTARMVRGSMIDALESDYVQMARLKGMPERRVIFVHALRNALVPTIQVVALTIAWLAGGIVVVEVVFGYPGIGQALANAVATRDLPTVQALVLLIAAVYVLVNLIADLATIALTPKLRQTL